MLAIAFDPSIVHTGVCIAKDGQVIYMGDIGLPEKWSDERRYNHLVDCLVSLMLSITTTHKQFIDLCVIEAFERHLDNPFLKLMKCSRAAGVIHGFMYNRSLHVKLMSKGTIRKIETEWLAKDRGVITATPDRKKWANALDAYQLLVCAGVCK